MITFVDRSEIEELHNAPRKETVMKDLDEFLASGHEVCEVDSSTYPTREACSSSYHSIIKRLYGSDMPVNVVRRKNRVFLVRK